MDAPAVTDVFDCYASAVVRRKQLEAQMADYATMIPADVARRYDEASRAETHAWVALRAALEQESRARVAALLREKCFDCPLLQRFAASPFIV